MTSQTLRLARALSPWRTSNVPVWAHTANLHWLAKEERNRRYLLHTALRGGKWLVGVGLTWEQMKAYLAVQS